MIFTALPPAPSPSPRCGHRLPVFFCELPAKLIETEDNKAKEESGVKAEEEAML